MKIGTFISLLFILACTNPQTQYINAVLKDRNTKDSMFKTDSFSPIQNKIKFKGLTYFNVNPKYKKTVKLNTYSANPIVIIDTKGTKRSYTAFGWISGSLPTGSFKLIVFKEPNSNALFLPFLSTEAKNNLTYKGGRYLDLEMPNEDMELVVDFNLAYHPYCLYNTHFSCPIIPNSNKLKIEILAGEKL